MTENLPSSPPSPPPTTTTTTTTPPPTVIKGSSDWRIYQPHILSNGVTCLLVQDKESKTTAMACCVDVGASSDPRDMSGLAHFTEHMCFLGSERYPGENEYKRYLSLHGGRSNASTSMLHTIYQFDILSPHAEKAVDIFSNFFINPLFTPSGTSREVQAVDSENSKNLTNDARRRLQILKALGDPHHSYTKFSTGDKGTLRDGLKEMRDALLAFHKRHYRPEKMVVVIVGPQDLETLGGWVIPRFESIRDTWGEETEYSEMESYIDRFAGDVPSHEDNPAFRPSLQNDQWPVLLTVLPLRDVRKLYLSFPLPPVYDIPDTSPVRLMSHLLGHEGRGSVFAHLQNEGLISALCSGSRIHSPDQCLFQIDLSLTEKGERQWKDVVKVVFDYCRLMETTAKSAKGGNKPALEELQRIWEEVGNMSKIDFEYTSPGAAYNFATSLSRSVSMVGVEKCLSAGNMLEECGKTLPLDLVLDYSSRLVPGNCIVERCSKSAWEERKEKQDASSNDIDDEVFGLKKEQWYGVEYYLSEIESEDVSFWEGKLANTEKGTNDPLHLPKSNRYIPGNLKLCSELPTEAHSPRIELEMTPPNLILDDDVHGRLWHKLDNRYALPKSSLTLLLRNASVEHTNQSNIWSYDVDTSIHSLLLMSLFDNALAQETYDASIAGLHWSLSKSSYGITLKCGGYSERLADLGQQILNTFLNKPDEFLKEEYFVAAKDRLVRNLKSYLTSGRADTHAEYYTTLLVSGRGKGVKESLEAVERVTLESLWEHHGRVVRDGEQTLECLYAGNVAEGKAREFFGVVSEMVGKVRRLGEDVNGGKRMMTWVPGPFERRIESGNDLELHFQSQNPEEQNGATLLTFQSHIPGFKGDTLSSPQSLKYTASIRLLSHMLREPLFDELRTKQQLGYIVSSYYDVNFSTESDLEQENGMSKTTTTPIDSIVVTILSKKVSPPEVTQRIDEFLIDFREMLLQMPMSEIRDHSDALGKKMLKPVQKLGEEVNRHWGKIRRYGPEVFTKGINNNASDLPWESVKSLAGAIQSLHKKELLEVWDALIADRSRARIASHVYGKTFLMDATTLSKGFFFRRSRVIQSLEELFVKRKELAPYGSRQIANWKGMGILPGWFRKIGGSKRSVGITAAAAIIGVGVVGIGMYVSKRDKEGKDGGSGFNKVFNVATRLSKRR